MSFLLQPSWGRSRGRTGADGDTAQPKKATGWDRNGYFERLKGVNAETFEYQPEGIGYEASLGVADILDLITAKRALISPDR